MRSLDIGLLGRLRNALRRRRASRTPAAAPDRPRPARVDPFRRFLIVLSVGILAASVLLGAAISRVMRGNLLAQEARVTAEAVRALTNVDLDPATFATGVSGATAVFSHAAMHLTSIPDIVRVKIYDGTGTIVWSDEPRAIGQRFADNDELTEALEGEIEVELGHVKTEHVFEAETTTETRLLEIYVPLVDPGSGRVYGVFEVYKHPLAFFAALDAGRRRVWTIAGTIGLGLFIALAGVFLAARRSEQRLEAHARNVEAQLVQSEKLASIGGMAAAIAHEINNPLGILVAKAARLRHQADERGCPIACREDLNTIDRELHRISGTLRGLLTFARRTETRMVPTDLNDVLRETIRLVQNAFHQSGIRVEHELAEPLPPVRADANQLQQVVLNLLQNARDAMPAGGTIRLRSAECSGLVSVEVQDTGCGIAREHLGHIFDPFYSTKSADNGSGLGLSVSYGIVKNHGGDIQVRSDPGTGACFRVTFRAVG